MCGYPCGARGCITQASNGKMALLNFPGLGGSRIIGRQCKSAALPGQLVEPRLKLNLMKGEWQKVGGNDETRNSCCAGGRRCRGCAVRRAGTRCQDRHSPVPGRCLMAEAAAEQLDPRSGRRNHGRSV